MTVENIGEVQTYLEANKDNEEVKGYVGSFINSDRVNAFLNGEEGKKILQPKLDTYHSKSLESWKTNNITKIVDEEVKKRFPDTDPRDTAMNALKDELAQMKADGQHKELTIKTSRMMQEKHLPMELLDILIGADEAITTSNLTALESVFKAHVEALVAERLKGGYQPPTGGKAPTTTTKEAFAKMGYSERAKMAQDNPELYKEMVKK